LEVEIRYGISPDMQLMARKLWDSKNYREVAIFRETSTMLHRGDFTMSILKYSRKDRQKNDTQY
jgi:hypothetical protein